MEINHKNSFRLNLANLILILTMTFSAVFGILELKHTFSYIYMVSIIYGILFQIMMLVILYAGFRELNPPEFLEFLENGYVQLLCFILVNLLLMDTSLVGLIIGSIIVTYSTITLIYIICKT